MEKQASAARHDVFLSHAFEDREIVLGLALTLQDHGYSVYLDWRDDPSMDRKTVTAATARTLRSRLEASRCLLFAATDGASASKWMPWELGVKDGLDARVAILPVVREERYSYRGQEYLGIYPYLVRAATQRTGKQELWIEREPSCYVLFSGWLGGAEPRTRD